MLKNNNGELTKKNKSKFSLGTVQLGLNYGIANQKGKPDFDEAIRILTLAYQQGVEHIDTAPSYGYSEKVIGQFIQKLKKNDQKVPRISSKVPTIPLCTRIDGEEAFNRVKNSISTTLESLGIEKLAYCLLHNPQNMFSHKEGVVQALIQLKEEGLIEKIGVSIYSPEDIRQFLKIKAFDVIQVPINIFDQRLHKQGLLLELKKANVEVHARSIFLQGLLLLNPDQLPDYLQEAYKPLTLLRQLAQKEDISIHELSLLFVRDLGEINQLVIGCESEEQLLANLKVFKKPPLSPNLLGEILNIFSNIPEKVINPTLWR